MGVYEEARRVGVIDVRGQDAIGADGGFTALTHVIATTWQTPVHLPDKTQSRSDLSGDKRRCWAHIRVKSNIEL